MSRLAFSDQYDSSTLQQRLNTPSSKAGMHAMSLTMPTRNHVCLQAGANDTRGRAADGSSGAAGHSDPEDAAARGASDQLQAACAVLRAGHCRAKASHPQVPASPGVVSCFSPSSPSCFCLLVSAKYLPSIQDVAKYPPIGPRLNPLSLTGCLSPLLPITTQHFQFGVG